MEIRRQILLVLGVISGLVLLGWLDYWTGPDIGISPLYLVPIGAAAWFGGVWIGTVMSALGAAIWFLAGDVQLDRPFPLAIVYWNALVRLSFFLIVTGLLVRVRQLTESLKHRVTAKSAALATERVSHKQTRSALENTEQQFQVLVEGVRDFAIFLLDGRGRIVSWNRGGELLTGFDQEQVMDKPLTFLWKARRSGGDRMEELLRQLHRDGSVSHEGWYRRRDGTRYWADTLLTTLRQADESNQRISAVVHDVTERKKLEDELLTREEAGRQHIGRELHDVLGQELTGLALLSKELEDSLSVRGLSEAELAARIYRSASQSVNEARRLSQGLCFAGEPGEGLPIALEELVVKTEDLFSIKCHFSTSGSCVIDNPTNQLHLYRITQEAITNAVKHGSASRIIVSLSSDDRQLVLRIEDNGTGLPGQSNPKSGIGLSIMHYRARAMGGYLNIQAAKSGGTCVSCTIPILDGDLEP